MNRSTRLLAASLAACLLLGSLAGAQDPNQLGDARQKLQKTLRDLNNASMAPVAGQTTAKPHAGLREQIRRLRALRTADRTPDAQQPTAETSHAPAADANVTTRPAEVVVPQGVRAKLDANMLARLEGTKATDPAGALALADALMQADRPAEAASMYALARQGELTDADAQWACLQHANALRGTDEARALGLYRRLLTDWPDSPYAAVANARVERIEWDRRTGLDDAMASALAAAEAVLIEARSIKSRAPSTRPADAEAEQGARP